MWGWFKRRRVKPDDEPSLSYLEIPSEIVETPAPKLPYRVYTRDFDLELHAKDILIERQQPSSKRKADARLCAVLEGIESDARTRELIRDFAEGASGSHKLGERPLVTILVDHSGSLRGEGAVEAARTILLFGAMLEQASVPFEVLGFTTSSWQGGRAYGRWLNASRALPGRLCELLHIVYREAGDDASIGWRDHLALLLDDNLLMENVDGEALLWARQRALSFAPSGWVCIVVSDGSPVDDATLMQNGPHILYDHLQSVIAEIEGAPQTRLGALGLKHDVAPLFAESESVMEFPIDLTVPAGLLERLMCAPARTR